MSSSFLAELSLHTTQRLVTNCEWGEDHVRLDVVSISLSSIFKIICYSYSGMVIWSKAGSKTSALQVCTHFWS